MWGKGPVLERPALFFQEKLFMVVEATKGVVLSLFGGKNPEWPHQPDPLPAVV